MDGIGSSPLALPSGSVHPIVDESLERLAQIASSHPPREVAQGLNWSLLCPLEQKCFQSKLSNVQMSKLSNESTSRARHPSVYRDKSQTKHFMMRIKPQSKSESTSAPTATATASAPAAAAMTSDKPAARVSSPPLPSSLAVQKQVLHRKKRGIKMALQGQDRTARIAPRKKSKLVILGADEASQIRQTQEQQTMKRDNEKTNEKRGN